MLFDERNILTKYILVLAANIILKHCVKLDKTHKENDFEAARH